MEPDSQFASKETSTYYRATLRALRFIEQRRPTDRRFGAQADAKWASFRGELSVADRIDLMIRDADTEWPGALGPRRVFELRAASEDEPFGSEWASLEGRVAADLWSEGTSSSAPADIASTFDAVASAWRVHLTPFDVPPIAPVDKLVLAGPSAIAAVAQVFNSTDGLAWNEQVVCVGDNPASRHFASMASALINSPGPTMLVGGSGDPKLPEAVRRALASDDSTEGERQLVSQLAGGEQQ